MLQATAYDCALVVLISTNSPFFKISLLDMKDFSATIFYKPFPANFLKYELEASTC